MLWPIAQRPLEFGELKELVLASLVEEARATRTPAGATVNGVGALYAVGRGLAARALRELREEGWIEALK